MKNIKRVLILCFFILFTMPSAKLAQAQHETQKAIYMAVITEDGEILAAEFIGCGVSGGSCLMEVVVKGTDESNISNT